MNKVMVIGSPGAGKSTFSKKLAAITGLPLYHLDMLWHKPDHTNITREEFDSTLSEWLKEERFVIDGNYNRTLDMRLKACDTVFLLDFPTEVCLAGIAARRGKPRSDMPWVEEEPDEEFIRWVRDFHKDVLPKIYARLSEYPQVKQYIFRSREEADGYIKTLEEMNGK